MHKEFESPPFAALFDMDGLMIDSERIQSDGFSTVMQELYGIEPALTEHGTIHTPGEKTDAVWTRLLQTHNVSGDIDHLSKAKRQVVLDLVAEGTDPMPGLLALFNMLHKNRIPIAVATSATRERAVLILQSLNLLDDILALVTADDVDDVKPSPASYLKAIEGVGLPAERCIVFEDAEVGVIAGKRAGAKVIAVPNQFTRRMNFGEADLIIASLRDVSFELLSTLVQ